MSQKILASVLAACALAACATQTQPPPAAEPPTLGRVHHYLRSNIDGALPERIVMYQASPTSVHVAKMVSNCTNAAYVTAELDPVSREPTRLVGGRLTREGTQAPFAVLTLDPHTRVIAARIEAGDALIEETLSVPIAPWRLYDFDLADLNADFIAHGAPRGDFSFGLALAWPEGDPPFFRWLGRADARFLGEETHLNRPALRYELAGPAFEGALGGALWLDAEEGHILEARFGRPNHPGYADYRLVLQRVEMGAQAWRNALMAHWRGCAPN